jgi:hypothetical protein
MDDKQPDPVAPEREPDHTEDPRGTEQSDQSGEEGPPGSNKEEDGGSGDKQG